MFVKSVNGAILVGESDVVDLLAGVLNKHQAFEQSQRFVPGESVKVTASFDLLVTELTRDAVYTKTQARMMAALLEKDPLVIILGAQKLSDADEVYYMVDHTDFLIPLPESFLSEDVPD